MRYKKTEATNILATFPNGGTITIDIYQLSNNSKIVTAAVMTEVGTTGIFKYTFNQTVISDKEEYLWIANDTFSNISGKIVLGGYVDTNLTTSDFISLS